MILYGLKMCEMKTNLDILKKIQAIIHSTWSQSVGIMLFLILF